MGVPFAETRGVAEVLQPGVGEEGLTSDRTWYAASPLPACVKDMFFK